MKTCKDCIYYETYKQQGEEYQRTFMVTVHACRLYPKTEKVDGKGCGQLKEKVHVISDPATDEAPEKTLPSQRLIEKWGEFLDSAIQTAMKFSGNTGQRL